MTLFQSLFVIGLLIAASAFFSMTEISLAGKQAVGRIKSEIASLIIAKATARGVKEAVVDPAFIKEMLVAVAKNWNGSDSGKVELQALLPEGERKKLDAAFEESAKELLAAGVETRCEITAHRWHVFQTNGGVLRSADVELRPFA